MHVDKWDKLTFSLCLLALQLKWNQKSWCRKKRNPHVTKTMMIKSASLRLWSNQNFWKTILLWFFIEMGNFPELISHHFTISSPRFIPQTLTSSFRISSSIKLVSRAPRFNISPTCCWMQPGNTNSIPNQWKFGARLAEQRPVSLRSRKSAFHHTNAGIHFYRLSRYLKFAGSSLPWMKSWKYTAAHEWLLLKTWIWSLDFMIQYSIRSQKNKWSRGQFLWFVYPLQRPWICTGPHRHKVDQTAARWK